MGTRKITALIPCYNEEAGVGLVIQSFPIERLRQHGYEVEIVVIDNNSQDETAIIARSLGATVIHEPKKGKGNAVRRGFAHISPDTDYVVMLDGDNTYRPEEILRLVELLSSGFCTVAIGSRLGGRIMSGSMSTFNRAGNWIYSHLVRYLYRVNVTDVLSGYFAWKHETLERLRPHLSSEGFTIEMEMITKMARLGEEIYCVPISYYARRGHTNLRPIHDGAHIVWMFIRNLLWRPMNAEPQRIAFVSDAVMPWHKGGKEKRLYEISQRLVREGREIHIYTMKWWDGPRVIKEQGVYYHALCGLHPLYSGKRRSLYQAIVFGFASFRLLFEKFDSIDVDHIPFYSLFSIRIITWMRGKKLYATWHEVWGYQYWLAYLGWPLGLIGYMTEYLALRLPDIIISNSLHTTERLRLSRVRGTIYTVPLGVDLEDIFAAEAAEHASDILFVGRLLDHKNAALLVRAIAVAKETRPDLSLIIVGDGPERLHIERLIEDLQLKESIQMINTVDTSTRVYGLMKASKMLVAPSVREGFGLVVVEAHAAGIPVITTPHEDNAAKDLIHEGVNGFLALPNEYDLAEKILHLLDVRATMEPRRYIEQYDWKVVATTIDKIFA